LRHWRHPFGAVTMLVNRKLRIPFLCLIALLIVGTPILKIAKGGHPTGRSAAYVTILDTLAGATPDPAARPLVKVTETMLTIVSIALIPLVTAAVGDAAVNPP